MYICIDVGGTKTLVACLDDKGVIVESQKIPTAADYGQFLEEVKQIISSFKNTSFTAGTIGVPDVLLNRETGVALAFGNLKWRNVSISKDIEAITNCRIFVENDAKLAGLSESMLIKDQYSKVLFITVSTGIGYSLIEHQKIDISVGDGGGRILPVNRDGEMVPWESFASGRAIVEEYGKMAKDIDDVETWTKISKNIAIGLIDLVSIFVPEVIVVGGSVGNYFYKYGDLLKTALFDFNIPNLIIPDLKGAERADEAVIYGCYDYTIQKLDNE
jgi:predicted NBD/HSP70 family sugar kinase